jgi:hypothetical protein
VLLVSAAHETVVRDSGRYEANRGQGPREWVALRVKTPANPLRHAIDCPAMRIVSATARFAETKPAANIEVSLNETWIASATTVYVRGEQWASIQPQQHGRAQHIEKSLPTLAVTLLPAVKGVAVTASHTCQAPHTFVPTRHALRALS